MLAGICTRGLRNGSARWSVPASSFASAGCPNPLPGKFLNAGRSGAGRSRDIEQLDLGRHLLDAR